MPEQIQVICQLALDLPQVQQYYHVDTNPERKPLRVLDSARLGQQPSLSKFGVPVVWVTAEEAKKEKKAYVEFTKLEASGDEAVVSFRYRVEGISVAAHLRKTAGGWTVEKTDVSER